MRLYLRRDGSNTKLKTGYIEYYRKKYKILEKKCEIEKIQPHFNYVLLPSRRR